MAQSTSGTTSSPSDDLWARLPRELRDEIFKLAYVEDFKVINVLLRPACDWKAAASSQASPDDAPLTSRLEQWHPRLASYNSGGYIIIEPWDKANNHVKDLSTLLVSKQWLAEALPIFVHGNHFEFCSASDLCGFVATHPAIQANITRTAVMYPFRDLDPPLVADLVNSCPKLMDVTLRWDVRTYLPEDLHRPRVYAKMDGNAVDLVAPAVVGEIGRLRGLDRLAIDMKACGEGLDDMARELEEEFREVVTQPRDVGGAEQV